MARIPQCLTWSFGIVPFDPFAEEVLHSFKALKPLMPYSLFLQASKKAFHHPILFLRKRCHELLCNKLAISAIDNGCKVPQPSSPQQPCATNRRYPNIGYVRIKVWMCASSSLFFSSFSSGRSLYNVVKIERPEACRRFCGTRRLGSPASLL